MGPAQLPKRAWQHHSAGAGSHGHRYYSSARIALLAADDTDTSEHHLLIRRNDATGEHGYLRCYSPKPVPLRTLVTVAGQRWRMAESFQAANGLTGIDQHQVRGWTSWHRWTALAMLAHVFLAVATVAERDLQPRLTGLIALTVNEFRRLFDALLLMTKHTITSPLPGHDGSDNTNTEPDNPTTDDANTNGHDLRLQYYRGFAPARRGVSLVSLIVGAPVEWGETMTGRPGPVYKPHSAAGGPLPAARLDRSPMMTVARSVGDVLSTHVVFEVDCVDRMYCNVYVPRLQYAVGLIGYLQRQLGLPITSTAPLAKITDAFSSAVHRFARDHDLPWVDFAKGQRKDDVMHEHLARFTGTEGVLFVGRAQEKTKLFRTEKRRDANGDAYPWIVKTTGVLNHFYFYCYDDDFGPFFLKFCSYFPYNAKLCINGNHWAQRQAAKAGIAFEPLDNGFAAVEDPAALQAICDRLGEEQIDALLRALSSLKGRGLSTDCRPVVLLAFGLCVGGVG